MPLRFLPVFIIAAGMLTALPAAADPPWQDDSGYGYHQERERHEHEYRHRHRYEREDRDEGDDDEGADDGYRDQAGPPPWAPAYGYRRGHHHYHEQGNRVVIVNPPPSDAPRNNDTTAAQFRTTTQQIGISSGRCNRQVVGTVVGGIVGGVIGNKLSDGNNKNIGTAAGVLIGAIVGNRIGRNMDNADANCTDQALERAPDGQVVRWKNPNTGYQYAVTPDKTYQRSDGRYCRDYTTVVVRDRKSREYRQTACRSDQGIWQQQ